MSALALLAAFLATLLIGVVSALMGLGGGLFLVPLLTLLPDVTWQQAAATSLVCTLATSGAGSVALDKARLARADLVVVLELAAAVGALVGASLLADVLPERLISGSFALLVGYAVFRMARKVVADRRELAGAAGAPLPEEDLDRPAERVPLAMVGCAVAGAASGLLGIGGGPIKVPVQTEICRLPLRVALANSNVMVGITAGVGAAIYFAKGQVLAALVAPCVLGIGLGAYAGGLIAPKIPVRRLRAAFVLVLLIVFVRMLWKSIAPAS